MKSTVSHCGHYVGDSPLFRARWGLFRYCSDMIVFAPLTGTGGAQHRLSFLTHARAGRAGYNLPIFRRTAPVFTGRIGNGQSNPTTEPARFTRADAPAASEAAGRAAGEPAPGEPADAPAARGAGGPGGAAGLADDDRPGRVDVPSAPAAEAAGDGEPVGPARGGARMPRKIL